MSTPSSFLYPSPSPSALQLHYIGKSLSEIQPPAAILDLAVIRRNCQHMLETTKKLQVGFRAHVKTHKVFYLCTYLLNIYLLRMMVMVDGDGDLDNRTLPLSSRTQQQLSQIRRFYHFGNRGFTSLVIGRKSKSKSKRRRKRKRNFHPLRSAFYTFFSTSTCANCSIV